MRAQLWGGQDGCDRGNLSATTDRSWSTCQALHDYGFVTVGSPERARGSRAIAVAATASAAAVSAAMAAGCEVESVAGGPRDGDPYEPPDDGCCDGEASVTGDGKDPATRRLR